VRKGSQAWRPTWIGLIASVCGAATMIGAAFGPAHAEAAAINYSPPANYVTGTGPGSVAVGDLAGNGTLDLVVPDDSTGSVDVLSDNGVGGFTSAGAYPAGPDPSAVALGQFDGSGRPDIAVSEPTSVAVLLNNGDGTFAAPTDYSVPSAPRSVLVADVNGDGKPDLVVPNGSSVSVFLGRGDGTFAPAVTTPVPGGFGGVAAGDLNGDGRADLAVVNAAGNAVTTLLGNADGTFAVGATTGYGAGAVTWGAPAIGDFTCDGKLDLAIPNGVAETVSILKGNGDGTFGAPTDYPVDEPIQDRPTALTVADIDGDGTPDLVVLNGSQAGVPAPSEVSVLLNDGHGAFTAAGNFPVAGLPESAAVGDFNGDGRPDLAVGNAGGTVSVLLNGISPPSVSLLTPPDGVLYPTLGQVVDAGFTCSDSTTGPGLASCSGPVADGQPIDTSTPGSHTFTVTATSRDGLQTSVTDNYIVVGTVPELTRDPGNATAVVDASATFTAAASGVPAPAVQWQVSTDAGTTWTDDTTDPGNATGTLTVTPTAVAQSGTEYRAVFTNVAGTTASAPATLTVLPAGAPVITTQAVNATGCYGLPAVFTAAASGDPAPTVQWEVSTDFGTTWASDTTDPGNATDTLTVTTPSQFDQYRAVFTNVEGVAVTNAVAAVGDLTPPPFTYPSGETVFVGQSATFSVPSAECYGDQPVQWQVSSSSGGYTNIPGATSATLTIPEVTQADNGRRYQVVVEAGSHPTFFGQLSVLAVPTPASTTVTAGATATFTISGLLSSWLIQWQVSNDGGATWADDTTDAGAATATLTVAHVTPSQSGALYRAVVTDPSGTVDTPAATLIVHSSPAITAQPTSETVTAPTAARFTAAATGNPSPTVQWQVSSDGGSTWANDTADAGNSTPTLTVAPTSVAQSGRMYRAVFTNTIGSATSATAMLTVRSSTAPVVTAVRPSTGGPFSLVLIGGRNLAHASGVSFGSGHGALFLPLSSSLVIALAPIESRGTVDVTVTTSQGTSATSSADRFTYR